MRIKTVTLLSALVVMPTVGIAVWPQPWTRLAALDLSAIQRLGHSAPAVTSDDYPRSDQPQLVYANGIVEGRQRNVSLRFELTGRLASVEVAEGDQVQQGQVLARLDSSVWQHQLDEAEAALASAQADKRRIQAGATPQDRARARAEVAAAEALLSFTKSRFERAAKLVRSRAVAKQELEDALGKHRVAVAEREAARARLADLEAPPRPHEIQAADAEIALHTVQVDRARTMLAKTELLAPSDGVILRIDDEVGGIVGPDTPAPLLVLADTSQLNVRAYVEELDSLRTCEGQRAYAVADGLPDLQFWGTVVSCAPLMAPKTHYRNKPEERIDVKVRELVIRLDDHEPLDRLVLGLAVDVFIVTDQSDHKRQVRAPIDVILWQHEVANAEAGTGLAQALARGANINVAGQHDAARQHNPWRMDRRNHLRLDPTSINNITQNVAKFASRPRVNSIAGLTDA